MKRGVWLSRKAVDPVNSVAWFTMDMLWLAKITWEEYSVLAWLAYAATGVTLFTGILLLFAEREKDQRLNDDLALNAWMWMNALWVISDLSEKTVLRYYALGVGGLGVIFLINAFRPSMAHPGVFRRFRKMRVGGR